MHQPFLARQNFHKCAKIEDSSYFALEYFAGLDLMSDILYPRKSFLGRFRTFGSNKYKAAVFDINIHAGLVDYFVDYFAAGADDFSDFLWINLEGNDARCVRRELVLWFFYRFVHFSQNEKSGFFGLGKSIF